MNHIEVINRMAVLGDALQLTLPAKAMAETLLLRAHYAKGIKEWQTVVEQIDKDTKPADSGERTEEQTKAFNEAIDAKSKEDAAIADRRYSAEAFEALCGVVGDRKEIVSALVRNEKGEPQQLSVIGWLEFVATNLVQE